MFIGDVSEGAEAFAEASGKDDTLHKIEYRIWNEEFWFGLFARDE